MNNELDTAATGQLVYSTQLHLAVLAEYYPW